jgi:hypothetical protein
LPSIQPGGDEPTQKASNFLRWYFGAPLRRTRVRRPFLLGE